MTDHQLANLQLTDQEIRVAALQAAATIMAAQLRADPQALVIDASTVRVARFFETYIREGEPAA